MKILVNIIVLILLTGMTIASGFLHGRMTDRWGVPTRVRELAARLNEVPDQFGSWRLLSSHEIAPETVRMLRTEGYINRIYMDELQGHQVQVSIVYGAAGPTLVHTPKICFDSRGYRPARAPQEMIIEDSANVDHEFWCIEFDPGTVDADGILVCYAWSLGGPCEAVENPRVDLAGHGYLYKIEVAAKMSTQRDAMISTRACEDFLSDFLPVLAPYLGER